MKTRKLSRISRPERGRPRLARGKQKGSEEREWEERSASPCSGHMPSGHPPSASSSRVTPRRSAISKACSRFSRLLWICTLSMSTRSGLQDTPQSHNQQQVPRAEHPGRASLPWVALRVGLSPCPGLSEGTWAAGPPWLILFGNGVQAAKENLLVPAEEEGTMRGLTAAWETSQIPG